MDGRRSKGDGLLCKKQIFLLKKCGSAINVRLKALPICRPDGTQKLTVSYCLITEMPSLARLLVPLGIPFTNGSNKRLARSFSESRRDGISVLLMAIEHYIYSTTQ